MRPVVYLSYAAQDADIAMRLRADLGARDIYVWDPRERLSFGTEAWEAATDAGIRAAQAVICVVSPAALTSANIRADLAAARNYTIPVLFVWAAGDQWTPLDPATGEGGQQYIGEGGQQYIDVRGSRYEAGLDELVGAILALPDVPAASAAPAAPAPEVSPWPDADKEMPLETERVRGWPAGHIGAEPVPPPPAPSPSAPADGSPAQSGSTWQAPPPPAPVPQPVPAPSASPPASAPAASAPAHEAEQAFGQLDGSPPRQEQATFSAYCPKEAAPREWHPLLVYISADTAAALAAVNTDATERLGARKDQFRSSAPREPVQLHRTARLTIVPRLPGFTFNPATLTVSWQEDMQRHEFRLSATSATPGQASNGVVTILEGPFLRAEIPISIFVQQGQARPDTPEGFTSALARIYRRIFPSYSRNDSAIVRLCEAAARAIGDRYLMDLNILRSGEQWDDRLLKAIAEADVFQLFWSETSARSPNVEREWRYALQLTPARPNFIRPVYWTPKPYAIPAELSGFHFDHLDPEQVGLKRPRFSLAALFGRA